MAGPAAASIIDFLLGLASPPAGTDAGNRIAVEGLAVGSRDGRFEIRIARLEAASLRLASGPLALDIGQLVAHGLVAQVQPGAQPRLWSLEAARVELTDVKVSGPVTPASAQARTSAAAPSLAPLATADGTLHAEIVDATLIFDADVTVPIRAGHVDFNEATVEHVGPDSRMGVSRMGIHVDAPNGRSYLYQFASAPVAGVEYERRSALPGPWDTKRGHLQLQPFLESLLRQPAASPALGLTAQARMLLARTALQGHVQLGDGKLAAGGLQAELDGRAAGHNLVRLHSQAVGRGVHVNVASLSVRDAAVEGAGHRLAIGQLEGTLDLQLSVEGGQVHTALDVARATLSGLRLQSRAAG